MLWEYGLWPLRNIIKKTEEDRSIFSYGIERYLQDIAVAGKENPEMVIFAGAESAPYYRWRGSLLENSLTLENWHKHLLAIGLEKPDDYRKLPIVGNQRAVKFDQYGLDKGVLPYQDYIDYVIDCKAMVFWAHPEARNFEKIGRITVETDKYVTDLLQTENYTGFTVFYEGYELVGIPEGIWDEILLQFCSGARKKPVWAIGGMAFDKEGDLNLIAEDLRTVLLLEKFDKSAVKNALLTGSMYVSCGKESSNFILDKFSLGDTRSAEEVSMGKTLDLKGVARLHIQGHFLNGQNSNITIKLIRDGKIIKLFEESAPFDIIYDDTGTYGNSMNYYRLEINSEGLIVISNPVFARVENK
jgi:hypothetical protein